MTKSLAGAELELGFEVQGWAARDSSGHLSPFTFMRRRTGPEDVALKISYCGVCHTDLHQIKNEGGGSIYPMVPGHEIVGIAVEVGSQVKNFSVGDHVGVGALVGSCQDCDSCNLRLEQFCPKLIPTYNAIDKDGTPTYGGYSNLLVCNYKFVVRIPENLPMDRAAPLLCAGITVYSPMQHFGMTEPGKKLGVVGLGGLGHMAVKFGKAFGLHVTVISTSPNKEKESREILGADNFIISKDLSQMTKAAFSLDYMVDTVSAPHDMKSLLNLLKVDGKLVIVGFATKPLEVPPASLVMGRRLIGGSCIGGLKETQEMLDLCGKKNISCQIEKIPIDYVNTALERLSRGDVKYRFVIDADSLHGSKGS